MKDYGQLIAELTIELKRINESLRGDTFASVSNLRVHAWLKKAGYKSI